MMGVVAETRYNNIILCVLWTLLDGCPLIYRRRALVARVRIADVFKFSYGFNSLYTFVLNILLCYVLIFYFYFFSSRSYLFSFVFFFFLHFGASYTPTEYALRSLASALISFVIVSTRRSAEFRAYRLSWESRSVFLAAGCVFVVCVGEEKGGNN